MNYHCVVLFSGGLDSTIALALANRMFGKDRVLPLYVDLGHPYAEAERNAIARVSHELDLQPTRFIKLGLLREEYGNMPTPTEQVIHGRNLILASIAASFGSHVWLAALEEEMHEYMFDKSKTFFYHADVLLSYTFQSARQATTLKTPFAKHSKVSVVEIAVSTLGIPLKVLALTSSCYDAGAFGEQCGACSTCFKRWVAFAANGYVAESYKHVPWTSEAGKLLRTQYLEAMNSEDFSHFSKERIRLTALAALRSYLDRDLLLNSELSPSVIKKVLADDFTGADRDVAE